MLQDNIKFYEKPRAEIFNLIVEGVLCKSGDNLPYVPPGGIEGVEDDGEL